MFALFRKDSASELRTRYALNSLIMFIVVTISVILFSSVNETLPESLTGGLLWVVVFFTAMSGLSRAFVSEEERGTTLTLQLIAKAEVVFGGKLIFNTVLIFCMNLVTLAFYALVMDSFVLRTPSVFFLAFGIGSIGISGASTVIAAIIAKANSKGTLYPVLSFPILLPLFLLLIDLTKLSIEGTTPDAAFVELAALVSYDVVIITASFLLFDFIWKD